MYRVARLKYRISSLKSRDQRHKFDLYPIYLAISSRSTAVDILFSFDIFYTMSETIRRVETKNPTIHWEAINYGDWLPSGGGSIQRSFGSSGLEAYRLHLNPTLDPDTVVEILEEEKRLSIDRVPFFRVGIQNMIPSLYIFADKKYNNGALNCGDRSQRLINRGWEGRPPEAGVRILTMGSYGIDSQLLLKTRGIMGTGAKIFQGLYIDSPILFDLDRLIEEQIGRNPYDYSGFTDIAEPLFFTAPSSSNLIEDLLNKEL